LPMKKTKSSSLNFFVVFGARIIFAPRLSGKNVITVSDGHALHITSYDGTSVCRTEIKSIESTQEETV
jgi:hypothetical protein